MTATDRIRERIAAAEPGWVFTPADLVDLGSPQLVNAALVALLREGHVRRVARGLYDVPRTHPTMGVLRPTADAVAQAIARRDDATIQPSEAMAANLLSLTEQVPARVVYETDGPSRTVRIGKLTIHFRRRPRRKVGAAAPMSSLTIAALRNLGRVHVTQERIAHLRQTLSTADRAQLLVDLRRAPAWMHPFLRYIAGGVTDTPATPATRRKRRGRAQK